MRQLFFCLTISIFALQACDNNDDLCLRGSGTVNDYTLELSEFDEVSLMGPINLRITQGSTQQVIVTAEPEIYGPISSEVTSRVLEIGYKDNITCFETDFGAWVNATVKDINEIGVEGSSEIESDGDLDLDRLEIGVSGTADVMLSGTVDEMIVRSSGITNAKNFNLITTNTTIDISGDGDFEVYCTGKLDIHVSGAATVKYKGNPDITQDVSGSLTLIDAN